MLDFFKDIISAFRQSSLERIKSPFLGAFVFSWIGFNWQMLTILFLSKQNILGRLDYINSHFDVGNYILGPIFTTIIICLLLPYANKYVTKFQKGTNHETNMLILQSKIDIATKQVEIADYEAKKKLAEEREKKYIDANIHVILEENINVRKEIKSQSEKISQDSKIINSLNEENFVLKNEINSYRLSSEKNASEHLKSLKEISSLRVKIEEHQREKLELLHLKKQNEELTAKLTESSLALSNREKEFWELKGKLQEKEMKVTTPQTTSLSELAPLSGLDHSSWSALSSGLAHSSWSALSSGLAHSSWSALSSRLADSSWSALSSRLAHSSWSALPSWSALSSGLAPLSGSAPLSGLAPSTGLSPSTGLVPSEESTSLDRAESNESIKEKKT